MEKRVVMIVGPTGVGKTGASVLLAQKLGTEIISADSMQIYRHMDIGTEKPSPEQLEAAPHHMVNIVEPSESFSAGKYLEAAGAIIEALHAEGRIPVVVGGTGLYIKTMTRGIFDGPEADPVLRETLGKHSASSLHQKLIGLDPETAAGIMPEDKRRIVRALEVCLTTGRKMSELKAEGTAPLPYTFIKIALTRDRKELYRMIDDRVDHMFRNGLVEEVKRILIMNPDQTPMQAIGYKEVAAYLTGEYDHEEAVRLVKRNTRRYAKRQYTWFNKEIDLQWVDITGLYDSQSVYERIVPVLKTNGII
ncbi:tRNA (adenosine(37)-N6)-dimethylallyltransferase MiaA [Nitrospirota bacterium]